MNQTEFLGRLFDNKPIVLKEPEKKKPWESGGERRVSLPAFAKCSHCKRKMTTHGLRNRLIVGATCSTCLERARFAKVQA